MLCCKSIEGKVVSFLIHHLPMLTKSLSFVCSYNTFWLCLMQHVPSFPNLYILDVSFPINQNQLKQLLYILIESLEVRREQSRKQKKGLVSLKYLITELGLQLGGERHKKIPLVCAFFKIWHYLLIECT
jgi:hypothetical protein